MNRRLHAWASVALAVLTLGGVALATSGVSAPGGGTVAVDNSLTFGVDGQRTRTVNSDLYTVSFAYPSNDGGGATTVSTGLPDFVPAPGYAKALAGALCSYSTPVVDGDMAYQYAFTSSGSCSSGMTSPTGVLYAMDLSSPRPANAWGGDVWIFQQADQTSSTTTQHCHKTPNMASVAAPTIDASGGYLAIAVGCYIYWNSLSNLQPPSSTADASASTSGWQSAYIPANLGAQENDAANESPIITPPLTVDYHNTTLPSEVVPESTPYVCAGDWNQGFTCAPMATYPGETPPPAVSWKIPTGYETTDVGHPLNWLGPHVALDNGGYAILTSSPSWDPQASIDGSSGAVVFGVNDGPNGPGAVVELDPVTGASTVIVLGAGYDGLTQNAAGVSSSVAVYEYGTGAPADGTMIVPDNYGDLYELSPSGQLLAFMTDPSVTRRSTCTQSPWDISDVGLGKYSVYAIEGCLTTLWRFGASGLARVGEYDLTPGETVGGVSGYAYSTGTPNGFYSPTVVRDPANPQDAYLFLNAQSANLYGQQVGLLYDIPIGSSVQASGSVAPISVTTGSPPFVAALPDAGSNHIVMVWSDADGGGFDYWVPVGYQGETLGLAITNNGTATSITVQVGDTVDFELYSNLPALGECDRSSNVAPNMTCVNLWQLASTGGQSQIVATDQSTLIGYYSTIIEASSDSTGAVWTTQVTYDQPGTYTLHGVLQNTAPNWPGGIDPSQSQVSSNSVTVVVKPSSQYVCTGYGCDVPCNSTAPGGWNTPANCQAPAPTAPPAQVSGKLTLAVGDLGSNYSPVYDPNWSPTSGEPDPCIAPTTACNSPYMAFLPTQYGLFGQHLLVQVAPPAYAPRPPDLSSPPAAYTPGVCKLYFPSSSQDFVTLPQGIAEETGQPWPTEWDPLQPVAGGIGLTGQVLVDWAWWPPLPFGTVVGPDDIVSHWVADVYRWIYHRVQVGTDSSGNPVYQWQASCDNQGLQGGETNPQVNPAEGGQVYVWGDRIVLIPVVTHELLWGWP